MLGKKFRPFVLPSIYVLLVVLFALFGVLLNESLKVVENKDDNNLTYVSYEVLIDYAIPTINENDNTIIRPYNDEKVTIGKYYYDLNDEKTQENAIIYYENTYMQNTGVDYVKEDTFKVVSILSGEVISVTDNDIVGKTVKVRHNDKLISIYQSLGEVSVKEHDKIKQGDVIGTSGTNEINSELKNHLHFELVINGVYVNPEKYYTKTVGEF